MVFLSEQMSKVMLKAALKTPNAKFKYIQSSALLYIPKSERDIKADWDLN